MRQACQFPAKIVRGTVRDLLRDVLRDRGGNILPIAAIGMLVAAVVVGSAVDLSRDYLVRQQLQSACDAGVLAGRRTVTTAGFDDASKKVAKAYFDTNFSDAQQGTRSTVFNPVSTDNGQTITGTATTLLDTLLMRIFGKMTFDIQVTCASSMGVGNSDIMMVLDTTGSMDFTLSGSSQKRIDALRSAMRNFYTTIYNATANSNARVRYGFVPFSSTVNVGKLLTDVSKSYIVDSYAYQSRAYELDDSGSSDYTSDWVRYSNDSWTYKSSCTNNMPSDENFGDYSSGGSKYQRKIEYSCRQPNNSSKYAIYWHYLYRPWVMRYHQRTFSTSSFKKFNSVNTDTGNGGANVSSTWDGCIQERDTVAQSTFKYSATSGITPAGALDLDLDSAPTSDDKTKWRPLWPEVSYRRWTDNGYYTTATTNNGGSGGDYCPVEARLLSTMSQSEFNTVADSLVAVGGTYLDIGMIWGGRLMSQQGMWSTLNSDEPSNGGKVSRHLIFMTDGEMEPNYTIAQAWGMEYWDRRVTSDGSTDDAKRHTQRFLASCEAIKAKGIRVWVVAFTSTLSTDLTTCASDDSSFTASSSADLNAAFQEIAKQVGELRVVQ
ncbi:pilus assembly protein TadG-related protein [Novosphingobium guangzhouense]|uniref:Pilus assembly protein TadG n=1 Tax=Novosphingobium guangzhouense TaxID=1850347 RepID=A0A2K2G3Z8_9SPHN|nr:pilus assembly protein TadG-related protein [Novosphingobium guangzhouense]PNU05764.1 pilus assembly protein TadG [Novosphingobium guangzhouense]